MSRSRIFLSYAIFILIGISASAPGVLVRAQMPEYGIDKATIALTFITFSIAYAAGGGLSGPLLHRLGDRAALVLGTGCFLTFALLIGLRPPFAVLVAMQLIGGFGAGMLDSVLNTQIARLPDATTPLNRLHAFFGVGALIGPALAAWQLDLGLHWTATWLTIAVLLVPLLVGAVVLTPARSVAADEHGGELAPSLLRATLAHRAVWIAGVFLLIYVGAEVSIGNWGPSLLAEDRGQNVLIAGLAVSGYWLGLTVGRFTLSPLATRLGYGPIGLTNACLAGTALGTVVAWAVPGAIGAGVGLVLVGFFFGPFFPTMVAVMPQLIRAGLMPTAIGVVVAMAAIGGALLPFVAGALADWQGIWSLLPYTLVATGAMAACWWRIAVRLGPRVDADPAAAGASARHPSTVD
jgi:fucose permease